MSHSDFKPQTWFPLLPSLGGPHHHLFTCPSQLYSPDSLNPYRANRHPVQARIRSSFVSLMCLKSIFSPLPLPWFRPMSAFSPRLLLWFLKSSSWLHFHPIQSFLCFASRLVSSFSSSFLLLLILDPTLSFLLWLKDQSNFMALLYEHFQTTALRVKFRTFRISSRVLFLFLVFWNISPSPFSTLPNVTCASKDAKCFFWWGLGKGNFKAWLLALRTFYPVSVIALSTHS